MYSINLKIREHSFFVVKADDGYNNMGMICSYSKS